MSNKLNIVETVISTGFFKEITETLNAVKRLFTIYVPNDKVIPKVTTHTLDNLLKPINKKQFKAALTSYIFSGKLLKEVFLKPAIANDVNTKSKFNADRRNRTK